MLDLAFPLALIALPLPLLVWWLAPPRREVVEALRLPFFEGASAGLDRGQGAVVPRRSRMALLFALLLWCLAILTIARPEWVGDPIERREAARDIMLAVDISGSMATRDFAGEDGARASRLDGVKQVLDAFIAAREQDRIGLIVFGSAAYVLVPFTRDTDAARGLLGSLTPGMAGQNTMLGDAIGLAIRSFEASDLSERMLILLTDGTDTGSRMAPAKAAEIAAQNGVVIHVITVGDPEAEGDDKVDIETAQAIAAATGGTFHRAEDSADLSEIYAGIDALNAREGASVTWRPRLALTLWPAGAFVLLCLGFYALAAAVTLFRRRTRA